MRHSAGTRVVFNADSLGTVFADGSTPAGRFTDVVVNSGEAGTVVDIPVPSDLVALGWFYVKPDKDDRVLVPVTDGFVELEGAGE
jgi:hypothetical protein